MHTHNRNASLSPPMLLSTAAIVGATSRSRGTSAYGSYWPSTRPETHARTVPICTAVASPAMRSENVGLSVT